MPFIKMHGCGNDYIYVNGFEHDVADPVAFAKRFSDRHTGIGGDGLILMLPPEGDADCRMRMFNIDGSEGEMCGNGIRCVAKLFHDDVRPGVATVNVETPAGLRPIELAFDDGAAVGATVDMGEPRVGAEHNGADAEIDGLTLVSMGNPHAVKFVDDLDAVDLPREGPALATDPRFTNGINAHFVQVLGRDRLRVLHWERGSGPTLACGTGACAVCVAGKLAGLTGDRITAEVPGGELVLEWQQGGPVLMTGPAVEVFRGVVVQ
ncbi:MAG: diaminopimelate epimerase [Planctomycetota bacterium]